MSFQFLTVLLSDFLVLHLCPAFILQGKGEGLVGGSYVLAKGQLEQAQGP